MDIWDTEESFQWDLVLMGSGVGDRLSIILLKSGPAPRHQAGLTWFPG